MIEGSGARRFKILVVISALPHNNHPMGEDPEITGRANGVRAPRQAHSNLNGNLVHGPCMRHGVA